MARRAPQVLQGQTASCVGSVVISSPQATDMFKVLHVRLSANAMAHVWLSRQCYDPYYL